MPSSFDHTSQSIKEGIYKSFWRFFISKQTPCFFDIIISDLIKKIKTDNNKFSRANGDKKPKMTINIIYKTNIEHACWIAEYFLHDSRFETMIKQYQTTNPIHKLNSSSEIITYYMLYYAYAWPFIKIGIVITLLYSGVSQFTTMSLYKKLGISTGISIFSLFIFFGIYMYRNKKRINQK